MKEEKVKDDGMAVKIEIINRVEGVDEVAPDINTTLCCGVTLAAFR